MMGISHHHSPSATNYAQRELYSCLFVMHDAMGLIHAQMDPTDRRPGHPAVATLDALEVHQIHSLVRPRIHLITSHLRMGRKSNQRRNLGYNSRMSLTLPACIPWRWIKKYLSGIINSLRL